MELKNKLIRLIKKKIEEFIDLPKSIRFIGNLIVKFWLASIDIKGIYHGEVHIVKYTICLIHLILMILGLSTMLAFNLKDSLWQLIVSESFPKNTRIINLFLNLFLFVSIFVRIDVLIDDWKNHLKFFRFSYFGMIGDREKFGLTKRNYKKIGILARFLEIVLFKISIPFIITCIIIAISFVAIQAQNSVLNMLVPIIYYLVIMSALTISLAISIAFLAFYYYKLLFDQINEKIQAIDKRSFNSISYMDQMRLLRCIKQHDLRAQQINLINTLARRSGALLFLIIGFIPTLPLHLYLESDQLIFQIIFLFFVIITLTFGFGVVFLLSMQIKSAHQPSKFVYKILTRDLHQRKFSFYFKWKVNVVLFVF